MRNFWLVARHEYRQTVLKKRFLITTLAIPLGMALLIGMAIAFAIFNENNLPLGFVDPTGTLDVGLQAALPDPDKRVEIREFPDQESAMDALSGEEIQAFFVLPPDYPQSLSTDLYYLEKPPSREVWGDFDDFLRINLARRLPEEVRARVIEGPALTVEDIVNHRTFNKENIINNLLPFAATFFFLFATMSAAGYMLMVVADEKENRMMEVMLTTVTPTEMIGGKAVGLLAAALTQLAIYMVAIVVGLIVAASYIEIFQAVAVPWGYLVLMALFFFPSYALISAVMIAIGSVVTNLQQAQQIAGILNLFFILPVMLLPILFENPGSPVMVVFTLFPTTAFLTISLRWGLGSIPSWQLVVSWVILMGSAVFTAWAASRVFQIGRLQYGQPLKLKTILAAIRGD